MSYAHITVRRISNGFVVCDGGGVNRARLSDGPPETFFATFDEMTAALPAIVDNIMAATDKAQESMRRIEENGEAAFAHSISGAVVGRAQAQRLSGIA